MSGIYVHIPFCKQRCYYCDFYTTTQLKYKANLVDALISELKLRKNAMQNHTINTIYFGGGTPSVLLASELHQLFDTIYTYFKVSENPEITLEANPDDLSSDYIRELAALPINRLSIGIQSFNNEILKLMNRRHSAQQAIQVVEECQNKGFSNISVDLIYGVPQQTQQGWENNLEQVKGLNIQHLSAYHLTFEPNTVFEAKRKKQQLFPIHEDDSLTQFKTLMAWAKANDFNHYEISNFAKDGCISQHNSSYWNQQAYLGIGPAAHSYNFESRTWNVNNLAKYIQAVNNGETFYETETLTINDRHNDYIITTLRTKRGINFDTFSQQFGEELTLRMQKLAQPFIKSEHLTINTNCLTLTKQGIFISDSILTELMWIADE